MKGNKYILKKKKFAIWVCGLISAFTLTTPVYAFEATNSSGNLQDTLNKNQHSGSFTMVEEAGTYEGYSSTERTITVSANNSVSAAVDGSHIFIENKLYQKMTPDVVELYEKLTCDGIADSCNVSLLASDDPVYITYNMLRYNYRNKENGIISFYHNKEQYESGYFTYQIALPQKDLTGIVSDDWAFNIQALIQENNDTKDYLAYQILFSQNEELPFQISISIPVKEAEEYFIYRLDDDNKTIGYKGHYDNGILSFETNQLTRYIITNKSMEDIEKGKIQETSEKESAINSEKNAHEKYLRDNKEAIENKQSDDKINQEKANNNILISIIISLVICTILYFTIYGEMKKKDK